MRPLSFREFLAALEGYEPTPFERFDDATDLPDRKRHRAWHGASLYHTLYELIHADVAAGSSILDIGAFPGTFLRLCRRVLWPGVDLRLVGAGWTPDPEEAAGAASPGDPKGFRASLRADGIDMVRADLNGCQGDAFERPTAESFDIVTCMEVIEHLHTPYRLLFLLDALVKPGGVCVVETNNVAYIAGILRLVFTRRSNLDFWLASQHDPKRSMNDLQPHLRFYSMEEIAHLLRRQGFVVEREHTFHWMNVGRGRWKNLVKRSLQLLWPSKNGYIALKARKPASPPSPRAGEPGR